MKKYPRIPGLTPFFVTPFFLKLFLVTLVFFDVTVLGQTLEDGWKGIKPLRTDKVAVDKLLGKPSIDDNGYAHYEIEGAVIEVNFSACPCLENNYGRGKYNVPKDFVLGYRVFLRKGISISDVSFRREDYHIDTGVDDGSTTYRNHKDGVMIGVEIHGNNTFISGFEFQPSKADAERLKCKL